MESHEIFRTAECSPIFETGSFRGNVRRLNIGNERGRSQSPPSTDQTRFVGRFAFPGDTNYRIAVEIPLIQFPRPLGTISNKGNGPEKRKRRHLHSLRENFFTLSSPDSI